MKVAHGLVGVAVAACAVALGLLVYIAGGTHDGGQRTVSLLTDTSEPPQGSHEAPTPTEPTTAPTAPTFMVGPWEVAVLSTNHDAAPEIGKGNHPDNFAEVLTTLQITNTADTVQDVYFLDFQFGALDGTENGYSPWDDWCAPFPDNVYEIPTLYLPGETRTVAVCVPVDPRDAAHLTMWVSYYDGSESDGEVERLLPPDGDEWAPRPQEDVASLQARALAAADRSAEGWGYHLTVSNVALGDVVDGDQVVSFSLRADPIDPSAPPAGYFESSGIGPSGKVYETSVCRSGEYWEQFDGTAWTQDLCMTVDASDAESMLLVFQGNYLVGASVHLDAHPT